MKIIVLLVLLLAACAPGAHGAEGFHTGQHRLSAEPWSRQDGQMRATAGDGADFYLEFLALRGCQVHGDWTGDTTFRIPDDGRACRLGDEQIVLTVDGHSMQADRIVHVSLNGTCLGADGVLRPCVFEFVTDPE